MKVIHLRNRRFLPVEDCLVDVRVETEVDTAAWLGDVRGQSVEQSLPGWHHFVVMHSLQESLVRDFTLRCLL